MIIFQRRFLRLTGVPGVQKPALMFLYTFVLCLLFSGCSWLNEIFVFNKTGETIVVRYSEGINYNMGNAVTAPQVYTIKSWTNGVPHLGDTISVLTRIENDTLRYVELPAGAALVIAVSTNHNLQEDSECKRMLERIKYLEVKSHNDATLQCRDSACFSRLFKYSRARAGFIIE